MSQPRTVKAFIHARETYDGEFDFTVFATDMSHCGYIFLSVVEVPVPDLTIEQLQGKYVLVLREKIVEIAREADSKIAELREKVARLEALTYSPTKE